jgi:hypothetical protein
MTKFNADLFKNTALKTEHAATLLSETELDAVTGGAGGMINPQPLPPRHGATDPRQW